MAAKIEYDTRGNVSAITLPPRDWIVTSRPGLFRVCRECGHRSGLHDNGTMRCTAHRFGELCACIGWLS